MACIDTCGSIGSYFKMAVEESDLVDCLPAVFDDESERYEILSENVVFTDVTVGGGGLTGGLDPIANHLRSGTRVVQGRILMEVGPNELAAWLPRILGNDVDGTGTIYTTAETFDNKPFDLLFVRDQGAVIYRRCSVAAALFRGRASFDGDEQVMQMALDIVGYEEHGWTNPPTNSTLVTWPDPAPALPTGQRLYWLVGDGTLTLDTDNPNPEEEYFFDAFNLLIDNKLVPQNRNFNTITCLQSRGRDIRLQVSTPYTAASHLDLYLNRFDGAGTLSFLGTKNLLGETEEEYTTIFDFPRLYQTRETPATRGRGEIPLSLDLMAYRTSSTEPISITNYAEAP